MILSLIFELAIKGKKILFCSQNPEALSVIIRKYNDIDRGFGVNEAHFSLLDICLNLNSVEQAKKSYIRNLKARLRKPIISEVPVSNMEEAPEVLNYIELDKVGNESVVGDLASDEIVRYALEYSGDYPQVPMMISGVRELNVRKIIDLITRASRIFEEYPEEYGLFQEPKNVLRFFNNKNLDLNLGQLLEKAIRLDSEMGGLAGIDDIKVNRDLDIKDALEGILLLARINKRLDVNKVFSDDKSLVEIRDALDVIKNKRKDFVSVAKLFYRFPASEREKYKNIDKRILGKENLVELRKYFRNLSRLRDYCQETIEEFSIEKESDLAWLISVITPEVIDIEASEILFGDCSALLSYGYEDIVKLLNDISEWKKISGLKKTFAAIPESFGVYDRSVAKNIEQNEQFFDMLYKILKGTNWKIKDLLKIKTNKVSAILSPYQANTLSSKIELPNRLLLVSDISDNIKIQNQSIEGLLSEIGLLIEQSRLIAKINFSLSGLDARAISELNTIIKKNIFNQELEDEIKASENEIKKYLRVSNGESLYSGIEKCLDLLKDAKEGDRYLGLLVGIKKLDGVDSGKLDLLISEIKEIKECKLFSSEYFRIKSGALVTQWQSYNNLIANYNDINQFNRWIEYNIFRDELYREFGESNERGLNDVFSAGFDSFAVFARYVVNNLLRFAILGSSFGKSVKKNYLLDYKENLKKARKNKYSKGLQELRNSSRDAAESLIVKWKPELNGNRIKEINKNFADILEAYPVIIATPGDVAKMVPAKKDMFDYVIIDEGSQMLPGAALPLFYRSKHAVVIGDPEQMPPANAAMDIPFDGIGLPELEPSIIDKMIEVQPTEYHLKVHYRSKYNSLFEPSRKIIYSKDGIDPVWEAKGGVTPISLEDSFGQDLTVGFGKIIRLIDKYTSEDGKTNFCIIFARKDCLIEFEDYLEQKNLQSILKRINNEKENEIRLVTILDCQGITYDHAILFLPYYNTIKSMYFFNLRAGSYRRANVAITRQTLTLDIVMGNTKSEWLATCSDLIQNSPDEGKIRSAKLLTELFTSANKNTDIKYLRETLGPNALNIDSPLTQQLYDRLLKYYGERIGVDLEIFCEVGYKIRIPNEDARAQNDYNVGFRIDLGIYSIRHQKFILGIEMDGATYHSGYIKEFSDMQRQEILEDKGWELYRIWSTNWRDNLNGEFSALVEIIDNKLSEPARSESEEPISIAKYLVKGYRAYKKKLEDGTIRQSPVIGEREDATGENLQQSERLRPEDDLAKTQYYEDLKSYARYCKKMGKTIELSLENGRTGGNVSPFQKLIVMNVADNYMEVRYTNASPTAYFRIQYSEVNRYRV